MAKRRRKQAQRESKIRYRQITKRLLRAADAADRAQAAHELRQYRESPIVKPLLQALQDPSEAVRWEALQTLRQRYFRLERFAKFVIPLLEDASPSVRVAVVDGLFEMIDAASMQAILFDVLATDDVMAQIDAVNLLPGVIQVKGAQAEPIITCLLNLLDADALDLAMAATQALGYLKVTTAVNPISKRLLYIDDFDANLVAIQALGAIGTPQAVDALLERLSYIETVNAVVAALGMAGDVRAVEPLVALLQQSPRLSIVDALGRLQDPRAVQPLATLLERSSHWPEIVSPICSALRLIDTTEARVLVAAYQ